MVDLWLAQYFPVFPTGVGMNRSICVSGWAALVFPTGVGMNRPLDYSQR